MMGLVILGYAILFMVIIRLLRERERVRKVTDYLMERIVEEDK